MLRTATMIPLFHGWIPRVSPLIRHQSDLCAKSSELTTKVLSNNRSIEKYIEQVAQCNYNVTVTLASTVFGTGTPIHYRYETINWIQVGYNSYTTHFEPNSCDPHLSSNNQLCTVEMHGVVKNASGTVIYSNVTVYAYFNANDAQ